jgi:hypothetical protein
MVLQPLSAVSAAVKTGPGAGTRGLVVSAEGARMVGGATGAGAQVGAGAGAAWVAGTTGAGGWIAGAMAMTRWRWPLAGVALLAWVSCVGGARGADTKCFGRSRSMRARLMG